MDANPQVENLRCSTLKKNQGIEEISFIPSDTGEKNMEIKLAPNLSSVIRNKGLKTAKTHLE